MPTPMPTLAPSYVPISMPTHSPTPGPDPTPAPTPVSATNPACSWKLVTPNSYCYGDWGVERKVLGSRIPWRECSALADQDPDCGDTAYGAQAHAQAHAQAAGDNGNGNGNGNGDGTGEATVATGPCRCVLKERQCLVAESRSGNSIYKRECNTDIEDPNPNPDPCSSSVSVSGTRGVQTVQKLEQTEKEVAGAQAQVNFLTAKLAVAQGQGGVSAVG